MRVARTLRSASKWSASFVRSWNDGTLRLLSLSSQEVVDAHRVAVPVPSDHDLGAKLHSVEGQLHLGYVQNVLIIIETLWE